VNRAQVSEYFKKFDALERRWKRWTTVLKIHGASLRVHIEGILIKEFQLVYQDELGGAWPAMIKKKLHEIGAREVCAAAKKAAADLKTGPCSRCKKAGLLFDERSLKAVSLCRICMNAASTTAYQQWRVEDAARSKREREEYRRKGFKFLLDVWIHPKRGGSDYYVEVPFKSRPTARDAEQIAREKGSAIGDDFSITKLLLLFALLSMAS